MLVPGRGLGTLQIRLAHLNHEIAKLQIVEMEERDEPVAEIDPSDVGNIKARVVECPDSVQGRGGFGKAINKVRAIIPQAETAVLSSTEISFRLHGLEFAQARMSNVPGTFKVEEEIIFGVAGFQARLTQETAAAFAEFVPEVAAATHPGADRHDSLWRMYPERWLESLVIKNVPAIDSWLDR